MTGRCWQLQDYHSLLSMEKCRLGNTTLPIALSCSNLREPVLGPGPAFQQECSQYKWRLNKCFHLETSPNLGMELSRMDRTFRYYQKPAQATYVTSIPWPESEGTQKVSLAERSLQPGPKKECKKESPHLHLEFVVLLRAVKCPHFNLFFFFLSSCMSDYLPTWGRKKNPGVRVTV